MTFHFSWAKEGESFSPHVHAHTDIPIFQLTLIEEENHFPKAHLLIQTQDLPLGNDNPYAFISWQDPEGKTHLLFQGTYDPPPLKSKEELCFIELLGVPPQLSEKLQAIQFQHHPLFQSPTSLKIMDDIEASSLYCDRRTLKLSRSSWFEGTQTAILGHQIFADSLSFKRAPSPPSKIHLSMKIQWIQSIRGLANIGQDIAEAFPNKTIASYTPLLPKDNSLRPGKRLGRSGYWVIRSSLRHMGSKPFKEATPSQSPHLHHYTWDFWVGWRYEQKRVEEVDVTLTHPALTSHTTDKSITIKLNDPYPQGLGHPWLPGVTYFPGSHVWFNSTYYRCLKEHLSQISLTEDPDCWETLGQHQPTPQNTSSFFQSKEGDAALQYALKLAWWYLAKSSRNFKVTFKGPWEELVNLTTDTHITLKAPHVPKGQIAGKVSKLRLFACGKTGEKWGEVTLTCTPEGVPPLPSMAFHLEEMEPPPGGLEKAPKRLLHTITITNSPEKQEELLTALKDEKGWRQTLDQHPTGLSLSFTDLRSCRELVRRFRLVLDKQ